MSAKAKLIIGNSSIEVEGSEAFVSHELELFRASTSAVLPESQVSSSTGRTTEQTDSGQSVAAQGKPRSPKKTKAIAAEKFDLHGEEGKQPSLEKFLQDKYSGDVAKYRILVVGYYITKLVGLDNFTEGHIDYAYRSLGLKGRPTHLRQIIINLKNENAWFEQSETGGWILSRSAEIFLEEKMPLTEPQ